MHHEVFRERNDFSLVQGKRMALKEE